MFGAVSNLKWTDNVVAPRALRIPPEAWEQNRERIEALHREGRTKQEIREIMNRDFSFQPTLHQYTTQFEKWDLKRYNKSSTTHGQQASGSASAPDTILQTEQTSASDRDVSFDNTTATPLQNPFDDNDHVPEESTQNDHIENARANDSLSVQDPFDDQHDPTELEHTTTGYEVGISSIQHTGCDISMTGVKAQDSHEVRDGSRTASIRTVSNASVSHNSPEFSDGKTLPKSVDATLSRHERPEQTSQMKCNSNDGDASIHSTTSPPSRPTPGWDNLSVHSQLVDDDTFDRNSVWESFGSNSELSILTSRASHTTTLTDTSRALPFNKYLLQLYPYEKLKRLRNFATKHIFHDWSAVRTINSILAEADFFRVSLVFHDAFDLYLFAYMLLTDEKIERKVTVDKRFKLQALAGCSESARNLSQVRLCRESWRALNEQDMNHILTATGFPLQYWFGHLSALEKQNDQAASHIQKAASEIGCLPFKDSAAVTSVLVRELVARYRHLGLQGDADSVWLREAHRRLNNGEFSVTMAGALRKLLSWCVTTLVQEKLDVTIKDCFSDQPRACVTSANGNRIPQQTIMLVVHFYCCWMEDATLREEEPSWDFKTTDIGDNAAADDTGSSTDKLANTIDKQHIREGNSLRNEAIELINNEMEISLLGIFTTLSRMIVEQTSSRSASASSVQEMDVSNSVKEKATLLLNLSGEDLETAFIRSYFFINARKSELGYGLHPQRYIRAVAIQNMPRNLVASGIGPDWLNEAASAPTPSIRSFSMQSSASSTRRLLYDPDASGLPQPSPRSSISLRVRQRLANAKRKYQPSVSSRQSRGLPDKILKKDLTGDTTSSAEAGKIETERELLRYLGQSMTSLRLE